MKISFISTVINESKTIDSFLNSILSQTKKPDEVIIVDGGSFDDTVIKIKKFEGRFKTKNIKLRLLTKKGNRSVGRNEAIKNSTGNIIACSDAGNILDKNWLKNIIEPFSTNKTDVVAGYYRGKAVSNFEKALVPYVLVMPDRLKPFDFLPATRSVAFKKTIWRKAGGFDEKYSHNEDYVFARRLKDLKARIVFAKKAIVWWLPRKNLRQAFTMFYRFAYGDIEAGIVRPKVLFIFFRYIFGFLTLLWARLFSLELVSFVLFSYLGAYCTWSVIKNYNYVKHKSALIYLPVIQITSDLAVMSGSLAVFIRKILEFSLEFLKKEKLVTLSIITFTVLLLSVINWGLPNNNHPFTYHMDEWHQLQSVRNLYTYLTPNMEGSANGPIFHFALSGAYIVLLTLLGLVDPFVINSSLTNLEIQNTLFIYLRFSTLLFSLASVGLLIYILKKQLKVKLIIIPIVLFLFSPIWISLSNYFKYDIALIFWMLLSVMMFFRFRDKPNFKNYVVAAVPVSLAVCTKISALPLVLVYFLAFLFYKSEWRKNIIFPIIGLGIFGTLFLLFGIPDLLIGTGDYFEYFHSNLARTPNETYNYKLGSPYWIYLFTNQIPTLFGFALSLVFLIATFLFLKSFLITPRTFFLKNKSEFFIMLALFIFAVSLVPMKLFIINRSLVLLPFMVIFIALSVERFINLKRNYRKVMMIIILLILSIHFIQGFSWVLTKHNDPREKSREWIIHNISEHEVIGIENVPIYQFLPDNVLFEYYRNNENRYKYEVVDSKSKLLPDNIIITNADIDVNYFFHSPKKDLLDRMEREGYKIVKVFEINRKINSIFTNRLDFYISLLSPVPNIYVYKK